MRGTKTAQTLVLVDGIKLNSATSGSAALQYLDPDQIERIEVVRGPRSSLYGADAVGGVIQIFTRKGSGEPRLMLKAGIGNRGTGEYGVNYSGESNGFRYNLGARLYETKGYDYTTNKTGVNADDDGYRNKSLSGSVARRFDNGVDVGVSFSHNRGKAEYDNTWSETEQPFHEFSVTDLSGYVDVPVTDRWQSKLSAGLSKEDSTTKAKVSGVTSKLRYFNTKRLSASWQNDYAWNDSQLTTAGLDYSVEKVDAKTAYKKDSRYNAGVFAQHLSTFEGSDLQIGLRHDKNQYYGNNTTGNIAWGFDLPYGMRLIPSYGTAFRAPTFNDLYYPGFSSNPDLKAEKSRNMELELKGSYKASSWSVSAFRNDMDDMIAYDSTAKRTENIEKARITGLELSAITNMAGWGIRASATFLDPENRSGAYKGKTLYRRATQLFTLDADRQFNQWSFGGTIRAQNKSWNNQANTQRVAGFATVDIRTAYQITKELKAEAKATNLLDKKYSTSLGYRDEPRGVFVTFIWSPEI